MAHHRVYLSVAASIQPEANNFSGDDGNAKVLLHQSFVALFQGENSAVHSPKRESAVGPVCLHRSNFWCRLESVHNAQFFL